MELTRARHPLRTGAALVGAIGLLTACGGGGGGDTATSSSASSTSSTASDSATSSGSTSTPDASKATITISDFTFSVPDSIQPGAEITVTNKDTVGHTVTADSGDTFDEAVAPGATVTFTAPDTAGDYAFHCTPHPDMTSTLVVK